MSDLPRGLSEACSWIILEYANGDGGSVDQCLDKLLYRLHYSALLDALAWYGNKTNYGTLGEVIADKGVKARAALEKVGVRV